MMRDPKRIDNLLHVIEVIWKQAPDLRLMQLLLNSLPEGDHYNTEDDVLEKSLRDLYTAIGLNIEGQ